jgi:septal ring factor EnvC (AmiA/AmiB activator)
MSKYYELLKKAENEGKKLFKRNFVLQAIQEGKWDLIIQDLQERAEQLRQTVATLEADREAFSGESSELKRQLQESTGHLQMLSQEVAARDRRPSGIG